VKVVDGDTIDIDLNGTKERIRLIGIDTPETVAPGKPVACYGPEASKKAKEMLLNKFVTIEADSTQGDRDKYERLLRYVFVLGVGAGSGAAGATGGATNYGKYMISEGYAREYTYDKAYKYRQEYLAAQKEAKRLKKGLWGACVEGTGMSGTTQEVGTQQTDSGGTSGGAGFSCTGKKTKCAQMTTCDEAYFYLNTCGRKTLDGDKDGVSCENLCK